MKTLVIYYSYDGNTDFIATTIAKHIRADVLRLEPVGEKKVKGFMKFIWGGKQVFSKEKPQLRPFKKNPDDYEFLIIGTPVWAWTYAPALATFFDEVNVMDKNIALFCCCQGAAGNVFGNMRQKLMGNKIVGEKTFFDPLSHDLDKNADVARGWVEGLGIS